MRSICLTCALRAAIQNTRTINSAGKTAKNDDKLDDKNNTTNQSMVKFL